MGNKLKELEAKERIASQELHDALNGKAARNADSYDKYCAILHPFYDRLSDITREITLIKPYELSELPDYGDHMTFKVFKSHVDSGGFIDYDGHGRYATKTQESDLYVSPSDVSEGKIRTDFTHVVWYNK